MVFCIIIRIGVINDSRIIFLAAVAAEYDSKLWEVIYEYVGAIKGLMLLCCLIMRYRPFLSSKCHGSLSIRELSGGGPVVSLFTERSSLDESGISLFLF